MNLSWDSGEGFLLPLLKKFHLFLGREKNTCLLSQTKQNKSFQAYVNWEVFCQFNISDLEIRKSTESYFIFIKCIYLIFPSFSYFNYYIRNVSDLWETYCIYFKIKEAMDSVQVKWRQQWQGFQVPYVTYDGESGIVFHLCVVSEMQNTGLQNLSFTWLQGEKNEDKTSCNFFCPWLSNSLQLVLNDT